MTAPKGTFVSAEPPEEAECVPARGTESWGDLADTAGWRTPKKASAPGQLGDAPTKPWKVLPIACASRPIF